jgi:hypothetical protein
MSRTKLENALDARRHDPAFTARMQRDGLGPWPWRIGVDEGGLIRVGPSDLERSGSWVLGRTWADALRTVQAR